MCVMRNLPQNSRTVARGGLIAKLGRKLRRENVRSATHVLAPALTIKNVSAGYGRENVRGFVPSPCSGHLYAHCVRVKARWRSPGWFAPRPCTRGSLRRLAPPSDWARVRRTFCRSLLHSNLEKTIQRPPFRDTPPNSVKGLTSRQSQNWRPLFSLFYVLKCVVMKLLIS